MTAFATYADAAAANRAQLLDAYNAAAEKPRKQFRTKADALAAVVELYGLTEAPAPAAAAPTPAPATDTGGDPEADGPAPQPAADSASKDGARAVRRRALLTLEAKDVVKDARPGTKRARVVELLSRPEGVTLDQVQAEIGWDYRTAYEGTKLVNVRLGYGLVEDPETGVIRIAN